MTETAPLAANSLDSYVHPFTHCMQSVVPSMKEAPDDPEAFCAYLVHEQTGEWPGAGSGKAANAQPRLATVAEADEALMRYRMVANANPEGINQYSKGGGVGGKTDEATIKARAREDAQADESVAASDSQRAREATAKADTTDSKTAHHEAMRRQEQAETSHRRVAAAYSRAGDKDKYEHHTNIADRHADNAALHAARYSTLSERHSV